MFSTPGWTSGSLWHDGNGEYNYIQLFIYSIYEYGFYCVLTEMINSKSVALNKMLKAHLVFVSAGWRVHGHVWHDGRINGKHGEYTVTLSPMLLCSWFK